MDVIELTRDLIRINSITGGKGEKQTLALLQSILEPAGFHCAIESYDPLDENRCNLTARLHPEAQGPALLFGGHVDTVPLGEEKWRFEPFSGNVHDGKIYGRGSSDMKSGVAAMVAAAVQAAPHITDRDFILQIYGEEETGCVGSRHAAKTLSSWCPAGAAVIGEPTGNVPAAGHRGTFWLKIDARGVTAHASTPELGESALAKLLPAASRLVGYVPAHTPHPHLGPCTALLSTFHSGININSVPDRATLTMDFRTVPGQDTGRILKEIKEMLPEGAEVEILCEFPALWSNPDAPWLSSVRKTCEAVLNRPCGIETARFATDGAFVRKAFKDIPIVILGPGEPALAHKTDEYCAVESVLRARQIYSRILEEWYFPSR